MNTVSKRLDRIINELSELYGLESGLTPEVTYHRLVKYEYETICLIADDLKAALKDTSLKSTRTRIKSVLSNLQQEWD